MTKLSHSGLFLTQFLLLFFIFAHPSTVSANITDFLSGFWVEDAKASSVFETPNSQKMAILDASSVYLAKAKGPEVVIEDEALVSNKTNFDIDKKVEVVKTLSPKEVSLKYYTRPITAGVRTQGLHKNNAVDLAASCGTPIFASASGTVTVSKSDGGWNGGYGNFVVINHGNGSQTLYSHMSEVLVAQGDKVKKGEEIGEIGSTGKVHGVTGCHVHFEIRNGPTNPF